MLDPRIGLNRSKITLINKGVIEDAPKVSESEITAGTVTNERLWSPADVVAAVAQHGAGGPTGGDLVDQGDYYEVVPTGSLVDEGDYFSVT